MAEVAAATVVVLLATLAPRVLGLRVGRTRAATAAFAGLGLHKVLGYGMLTIGSMLMLRVLATILRPRR